MSDKDKNMQPFAWNELLYEGSKQRLTGSNEIKLNAKWYESNSGSNNRINVTFNVSVRWDIRGTWPFRIKINGTQVASDSVYISFGSTSSEWSSSQNTVSGYLDIPKTNKSATVDLYIDNMDYWDATTGEYRNGTVTQRFTLSLVNTEIIPGDPEIMILATENGAPCRVDYTNVTESDGISYRCYPAESAINSGIDNTLRFYTYKTTNATHSRIVIQKYSGGSWNAHYDSNWQTPVYHSYHRKFTSSERVNNNVWWRVKAYSMSSTSNTKETGWIYFFINDVPVFANNNPNLVYDKIVPAIKSNIGITWNAAQNVRLTTKYTIRYRASITSTWSYAECLSPSFTLNASNLSAYPRGCTIYFDVTPWDQFDQTGYVGSGAIKVNTLPTTSSSTIYSDKDSSEFNYRYLNNVNFTLPSISDVDGQNTKYYLDYSINNGNSWISYSTNAQPGNIVIDCSNFQNTRGGVFRLRATPHDGLEFGSSIYSYVLYKNQLPTLSSTIIQTDKDGMPYNKYYKDNVTLTLPSKSDADGHGCYYRIDYLLEGNNNWVTYNSLYNSDTITINCDSLQSNRGKYIKFKVVPFDVFEEGTPAYSGNLIKNVLPKPPSLTTNYGKQYLSNVDDLPHNGHVEKILQITWLPVKNECNDVNIENSKFKVDIYKGDGTSMASHIGKDLPDGKNGIPLVTIDNNYLNVINRNDSFYIEVTVTDIFNESSKTKIGPYVRNSLPTKPTDFHMGYSQSIETSGTNRKYRRAYFNKSTDLNNDTIYYELQVQRNNTNTWTMLYNNYINTNSSINWDFTDDTANCNDIFRIRSIDIHGAYSDWANSNDHTLPTISIFAPISKVYNKYPRILFGFKNTVYDTGYINVEVTVNGYVFNNISHPMYFSNLSFKEGGKGVFRIPEELVVGDNTVTFKTYLGKKQSSANISVFKYSNSLQSLIDVDDSITASINNNILTMVNDYYNAYKCTFSKLDMPIKQVGEISTALKFNNMYTNLFNVNESINNYDSEFNGKLSVNMGNPNVAVNSNHRMNDINFMINMLTTQI